jgi:hypothetical protein
MSDESRRMKPVGGVETSRGIVYQNAQAALAALDVLMSPDLGSIRVEGTEDILDIEIFDTSGRLVAGQQVKTRDAVRPWGKKPIIDAIHRWAELADPSTRFEFVTDGLLGPSARTLQQSLESAADEDLGPLADFLDVDKTDPAVKRFVGATVRQDIAGAEAVLGVAARRVRSMLVDMRSPAEAERQASEAITRLWSELALRSTRSDPAMRLMTKAEIAEILGGVADLGPEHQWAESVRVSYLDAVRAFRADAFVEPVLGFDEPGRFSLGEQGPLRLLGAAPCMVSGHSGTGKTTAFHLLARAAAGTNTPVVVGHAEAYVPGRLADFVTDAIAAATGSDLPSATGAQALDDLDVVLVIDGVSEVPRATQRALRDDLRVRVAAGRGARVVLSGRDRTSVRAVFPTATSIEGFVIRPFDDLQRNAIVEAKVKESGLAESQSAVAVEAEVVRVATAVTNGLGDAADNPMLFSMAVDLVLNGVEVPNAGSLFSSTLERIAAKVGAANFDLAISALGSMFATLLDDGRRYVHPHEYRTMLTEAVDVVARAYFDADVEQVHETIERCGLLSTIVGAQVLAPIHDSYADYLAARAHRLGFAEWPQALTVGDELRIEFAAHLNGLTPELTGQIAADIPFSLVRLAESDARVHDEGTAGELAQMLDLLIPGGLHGPLLWRSGDRVVATLAPEPARWVDENDGRKLMMRHLNVVIARGQGPLVTAARLWRLWLATNMSRPTGLAPSRNLNAEEAVTAITDLAAERTRIVQELVDELVPNQREAVLAAIGDTGLSGFVLSNEPSYDGTSLSLIYRSSPRRNVRVSEQSRGDVLDELQEAGAGYSETTVRDHLGTSAAAAAQTTFQKAVETLAETGWLS